MVMMQTMPPRQRTANRAHFSRLRMGRLGGVWLGLGMWEKMVWRGGSLLFDDRHGEDDGGDVSDDAEAGVEEPVDSYQLQGCHDGRKSTIAGLWANMSHLQSSCPKSTLLGSTGRSTGYRSTE